MENTQTEQGQSKFTLSEKEVLRTVKHEETHVIGKKTTVVLLTLENGYEIVGSSSCVDPKNFDAAKGYEIAKKRALDQIWMLEGYVLQNQLHSAS